MKKKIAVVMGGYSPEFDISVKSGTEVCHHLDPYKFDIYPVIISKNNWVVKKGNRELRINRSDFSIIENGKKITFDCVFNTIHGNPGENGYLRAYLNLIGLTCAGCDVEQYSLTSNKYLCKQMVHCFGVRTAKAFLVFKENQLDEKEIIQTAGFPCFVKPNGGGSSFNTYKVKKQEDLRAAILKAKNEGSGVLIEEFIEGIEVSVGALTYKNELHILPITEIKSELEFFNYKAKYQGCSQEITPAKIPVELEEKIKSTTKKVYQSLGMSGFSRTDYIIRNNEPYFLEINTTPGLTKQSILPQQINHYGLDISDVFEDALFAAMK